LRFANAKPRNTNQSGYGIAHKKARRKAFADLDDWFNCCRCGQPTWKHSTEPDGRGRRRSAIHYDHTPDRVGYYGFSCAACNRLAGARVGGWKALSKRRTIATLGGHSRQW
jgi:hypothetical protein